MSPVLTHTLTRSSNLLLFSVWFCSGQIYSGLAKHQLLYALIYNFAVGY